MANGGQIEVEVKVTGNLMPIARAFTLMSDALKANGHVWSREDEAVIEEACERICQSAGLENRPDLDGRGN